MRHIITATCANRRCRKVFQKFDKPAKQCNLPPDVRRCDAVTCSPSCSKDYNRDRLRQMYRKNHQHHILRRGTTRRETSEQGGSLIPNGQPSTSKLESPALHLCSTLGGDGKDGR